ncbi:cytochrome c oxidase assembly protein COX16 homolog, mitochondrial isoform X2 [Thrips palmi]|uniref:Cytochrome c oxidase assembly protein COX16 homolog, mitochondrial n=1 Tax=Thrips palmi TaxID=161013 RepID=A0A6P8YUP8_THRPL|nr:cytochrome c oxidase assembly protein COX16 homolog, mitochondrial isoform X2 [Thrips palmi]
MASSFAKYRTKFEKFKRSKHFNFGLPFLLFVVGGSFALKEFAKVRYEFTHVNPFDLPIEEKIESVRVDPEKEYDNIMNKIDLDNWENKRIPRPWEEQASSN